MWCNPRSNVLLKARRYVDSITRRLTSSSPVRVRFAPSPTGSLHIGGVRTAMFNWLLARKTNGSFIVRVEDTDEARSIKQYEESILRDLKWMNLQWDEGPHVDGPYAPYRQSERLDLYKATVSRLILDGKAYRCFCSEEELKKNKEEAMLLYDKTITGKIKEASASTDTDTDTGNRNGTHTNVTGFGKCAFKWRDAPVEEVQAQLAAGTPYTVRFKVPYGKTVGINDLVRGKVTWDIDSSPLHDFIIMRTNGIPVYNFCVAVDDSHMKITHVLRAEEHLSNTLKQILILEALGSPTPVYAHCSLILGPDKQKLSKRHGAMSVTEFRELGFIPAAMMNYLANLGWNDGTPKEIYSPHELVNAFDTSRIIKGSAVFDMDKLRWINGQHLKQLPAPELERIVYDNFMTKFSDMWGKDTKATYPGTDANTDSDSETENEIHAFIRQAIKIAHKDLQVVTDVHSIMNQCMSYNLESEMRSSDSGSDSDSGSSQEVINAIGNEKFKALVDRLVFDYDAGIMPLPSRFNPSGNTSTSGDITSAQYVEKWNTYIRGIGFDMRLKGKFLLRPVRLALTGRTNGPDVGDQIFLWQLSQGLIKETKCLCLKKRVDILRTLDIPPK